MIFALRAARAEGSALAITVAHLRSCTACERFARELEATVQALRALGHTCCR